MLKLVKRNKPLPEEMAKKTHILPDFENPPINWFMAYPPLKAYPF
jgi:hypothetical protein